LRHVDHKRFCAGTATSEANEAIEATLLDDVVYANDGPSHFDHDHCVLIAKHSEALRDTGTSWPHRPHDRFSKNKPPRSILFVTFIVPRRTGKPTTSKVGHNFMRVCCATSANEGNYPEYQHDPYVSWPHHLLFKQEQTLLTTRK
jgi:hypothetical protein